MRYLFLLFLAFSSSASFAATTYFWVVDSNYNIGQFASPSSACSAYAGYMESLPLPPGEGLVSRTFTPDGVEFVSVTRYMCYMKQVNKYEGGGQSGGRTGGYLNRGGDTCPENATYEASTGLCNIPEPTACEKLTGASTTFNKAGVAPDAFVSVGSGGRPITKREGCFDGCYAELEDIRCTHKTSGSYTCKLKGSFSGAPCDSSPKPTGPEVLPADAPEPEPKTENTKQPCVYSTGADGKQTCESTNSVDKEGKNCGVFNGQSVCVDKNATKNEVKIKTDVKSEPTPDGGTKITKTDTVNVTTCTGINSCSTTVSTNTTTTTKDANGNTTGSSSSCVGPSCTGNSPGGSDGDGDGMTDCTSDCGDGEGGDPELEEVAGFGDSTKKFVDRVEDSNIAQSISSIKAPSGGQCYAPSADTIVLGEIKFDGHCQVLDGNRNLIKLLAKTLWAMAAVAVFFW